MIEIETTQPEALLANIKKAIDEKHIRTWEYDKEGDFTHSTPQWNKKAWLRPKVTEGQKLSFSFLEPKDTKATGATVSEYYGSFTYELVYHFTKSFTSIKVTPPSRS